MQTPIIAYTEAGIPAGARLDFSRPFVDATGKTDTASFRLAFASVPEVADTFLFACERVNAPKVDRSALQRHDNGAVAIAEVIAISANPSAQLPIVAAAAGVEPAPTSQADELALPNAQLSIVTPHDYERRFGLPAGEATELRFAAVVFSVASVEKLRTLLAQRRIGHDIGGNRAIVAPAPGQGAAFIFEEQA